MPILLHFVTSYTYHWIKTVMTSLINHWNKAKRIRHAGSTDHHQHQMVRLHNNHGGSITHKMPTDTTLYCPRSPPPVWSSTPVSAQSSCPRHLHLQPECGCMVETPWSPSNAMVRHPCQRPQTAGDNIAGGF